MSGFNGCGENTSPSRLFDRTQALQLFVCNRVSRMGRDDRGSPMTIALTHAKSTAAASARTAARDGSFDGAASDEALIRRIAAGDQLAMRTLFARHRIPLYRWLLRIVRDETTAEDLLSDVFLDVWRQAASFKGRASVSTWLLAIARARRARVDTELLDERITSTIGDPADTPEAALQEKRRGELLRESLAKLSPENSEVIDLVYYHGKSVKEVAEIVGVGEATVKTRMFYARRKLASLVAAGLPPGSGARRGH